MTLERKIRRYIKEYYRIANYGILSGWSPGICRKKSSGYPEICFFGVFQEDFLYLPRFPHKNKENKGFWVENRVEVNNYFSPTLPVACVITI